MPFIAVKDHGAIGDGVANDTAAINATIAIAKGLGGGRIYFEGHSNYKIFAADLALDATTNNITFYGDGDTSQIKLAGTLSNGVGIFDIAGSTGIAFEDLLIDGGRATAVGLDWSTISDPAQANLTNSSSVWIHGGSSNIRFTHVTFRHTCGYAIYLDATSTGDIDGVEIDSCHFINNRAHTFGTGGVNTYQAWTSGVHYQGDGTSFCVKNLSIHDCSFRRSPGSQIWGHLYAFTKMHKNVTVDNCIFEDVGLEGVELGGTDGGGVTNCFFHRTGFVTGNSDTATATPAWLSNHQGTALDTAGLCTNMTYANNRLLNCNGGYIDLDGFGQGVVTGNSCVCSQPGDPEYTEDQVASFGPGGAGPQYVYGINCDNTSGQNLGGASNVISGNFISKLGGGAIRLYGARNCKITGNNINHLASPINPPIAMGPVATGANYRATGNVITDNVINWNPSTLSPAIVEDPVITAFVSTDKNWVYGNQWGIGSNVYEFKKDPNSGSVSRVVLSSISPTITSSSETWTQREDKLTRWYKNLAGTSTAIMTLQDAGTYATAPTTPGPLLNVTNGAGNGGVITTGGRTTLAYDDAVATGKGYFDSHIALADTTRVQADEDIIPGTAALIRYRSSVGHIEQSTSVSSGVRVWTPLSLAIGGSDTQVQFNALGTLLGSPNFTWSNAPKVLTINGATGTAGLTVNTSYIQAAEGFLTSSVASNAIQAPSGGVAAKWLIAIDSLFILQQSTAPPISGAGQVRIYANTSGQTLISTNAGAYVPFGGSAGGSNTQIQYNSSGGFAGSVNFTWNNGAQAVVITGIAATAGLTVVSGYIGSDGGFATPSNSYQSIQSPSGGVLAAGIGVTNSASKGGYIDFALVGYSSFPTPLTSAAFASTDVLLWACGSNGTSTPVTTIGLNTNAFINAAVGFVTPNTAANAIQAPSGGIAGKWLVATDSLFFTQLASAPPLSGASQVRIYASTAGPLLVSINGGPYGAFGTAGGANANVQYNASGAFGGSGNFTWNNAAQSLSVTGITATAGLSVLNGYASADGGFVTTSNSYQAIQSPIGGGLHAGLGITNAASKGGYIDLVPIGYATFPTALTSATFGGSDVLLWACSANGTVTPVTSFGLMTNAFVSAAAGFVSLGSNDNIIQAPNGGMTARRHISTFDIVAVGVSSGFPTGAAGQGKIYFDSTVGKWKAIEGAGSAVNLIGGGTPGGTDTQIQYNSSGSFAGSINLVWSNSLGILTVGGTVQASTGFNSLGSADNSIQCASGGVTARRHITTFDFAAVGISSGFPTGASGQGKLYFDSSVGRWKAIEGLGAAVNLLGATPGGADTQVQYNSSGAFAGSANFVWTNSLSILTIGGTVQASSGFNTTGAADNVIQAASGGVTARRIITTFDLVSVGMSSGFPTGAAGQGKLYYDTSVNKWKAIEGAAAAVNLLGGGGSPGGSTNNIQFNNSGSFGGSASFTWNDTSKLMTVFGFSGTAGIAIGNGYMQSDGGYLVTSTNTVWNTIQSSGGLVVKGALQVGSNFTFDQGSAANGFLVHTLTTNNSGGVIIDVYDTSSSNPFLIPILIGRKINGTPGGSIFATQNNAYLFSFGARGSIFGAATTSASATINMMATENWGSGNQGAEIQFATVANGTTSRTTRMYVRNTGTVEIMNGFYAHFGLLTDQGLYSASLGTGITPSTPSFGYAAIGHRSGSTWWYFNPSTASWSFVDFAAAGGATTTVNGQGPGAISIVGSGGISTSSGGGVISIGQIGLAVLANSQIFTNLNRFSGSLTIFDAQVTVGGTLTVNGGVSPNGSAGRTFSFQDLAGVTHNVIYGIIVS